MRCSHRYESEAWGFQAAQPFFNQALEISTDLTPHEVLDAVQAIERELGRNRAAEQIEKAATGARYASRPIDIDILFYSDQVIGDERLQIPHPQLAEREFALAPLNEIMRAFRHPVTGRTVGEMLAAVRAAKEGGAAVGNAASKSVAAEASGNVAAGNAAAGASGHAGAEAPEAPAGAKEPETTPTR